MASEYKTESLTLNANPTTVFQATNNTSYIIAKLLLKNEKTESAKITVKLNNLELIKDLLLPIFSNEFIELSSISKLKLSGTDKLDISVTPDSVSSSSAGSVGGFPWYTTGDTNSSNTATIILNYVNITQ